MELGKVRALLLGLLSGQKWKSYLRTSKGQSELNLRARRRQEIPGELRHFSMLLEAQLLLRFLQLDQIDRAEKFLCRIGSSPFASGEIFQEE